MPRAPESEPEPKPEPRPKANLCDAVSIVDVLDRRVLEALRAKGIEGESNPGTLKFSLMLAACLLVFFFIGVPKLLGLSFESKKPLLAVGSLGFFALSLAVRMMERTQGHGLLVLRSGGKRVFVNSYVDRKTGDYVVSCGREILTAKSIGRYFDKYGYLGEKNFDEDVGELAGKLRLLLGSSCEETGSSEGPKSPERLDSKRTNPPASRSIAEPAGEGAAN